MKLSLVTLLALVAAVHPLRAEPESTPEQVLAQLAEQHDKALTAATDPIHQLYRTALDLMLQKAKASEDMALVAKIESAIARIHPDAKSPGAKPATADELNAYLAGTVWNISDERPDGKVLYTMTFLKNGTFIHSDGRTGAWSAQSPRDLKLWNWDPAALNDDLTQFRAVGTGVIYFGNLKKD
jgi:hypothetical protein